MKFTIELNDTVVAMRNGASVSVLADKLTTEMVSNLLAYGIGQKVRDSASQASTDAKATNGDVKLIAQDMMDKAVAAIYEGKWSVRGEGSGADTRTLVARSQMRKAMKEKFGSKSPEWAKFTGLSDADQIDKLDENIAANAEYINELVDEELARREAAEKSKKAAAKKVTFTL